MKDFVFERRGRLTVENQEGPVTKVDSDRAAESIDAPELDTYRIVGRGDIYHNSLSEAVEGLEGEGIYVQRAGMDNHPEGIVVSEGESVSNLETAVHLIEEHTEKYGDSNLNVKSYSHEGAGLARGDTVKDAFDNLDGRSHTLVARVYDGDEPVADFGYLNGGSSFGYRETGDISDNDRAVLDAAVERAFDLDESVINQKIKEDNLF